MMVAKIVFLVLLGTALALAIPIPEEDGRDSITEPDADQPPEVVTEKPGLIGRFVQSVTNGFKSSFKWVKKAAIKIYKKFPDLKDKALSLYEAIKQFYEEVRGTLQGKEVEELIDTVQKTMANKDIGHVSHDEAKSDLKKLEKQFNNIKNESGKE